MDAFERAKTDSKKVDVLSGTSSEADTTVRASYRAKYVMKFESLIV